MVQDRDLSTKLSRRDALKITGGAALAAALPFGAAAQDATPAATDGMFPSPIEGVPNAYYKYPTPFQTVTQTPGSGGTVKLAHLSDVRIKPRDENQYWKELET